jgi:peptide/nickel transport system permease protein
MLSRPIFGARLSPLMGVNPVILARFLGSAVGHAGGWINSILMRTIDVFFAFPSVLLAIALSGAGR